MVCASDVSEVYSHRAWLCTVLDLAVHDLTGLYVDDSVWHVRMWTYFGVAQTDQHIPAPGSLLTLEKLTSTANALGILTQLTKA